MAISPSSVRPPTSRSSISCGVLPRTTRRRRSPSSDQITVDAERRGPRRLRQLAHDPTAGGHRAGLGLISVIVGRSERSDNATAEAADVNGRGVGTFQPKQLEADMAEMEAPAGSVCQVAPQGQADGRQRNFNVKVDLGRQTRLHCLRERECRHSQEAAGEWKRVGGAAAICPRTCLGPRRCPCCPS